ncbi:MAG: LCP family protein [Spirochaetales bacterium]|nr:LCP family protein [Spirochaetales bacterium]
MKRNEKSFVSIILLGIIVCIAVGSITLVLFVFRSDRVVDLVEKNSIISVLFTVGEKDHLDMMELYLYNPATKKSALFHLPANLWTMIEPLNRYDILEVMYNQSDFRPLMQKVEKLTSVKVDFFIDIDFREMEQIVDLLGGLEVFIPNPVDTEVNGERILLEAGSVIVDGEKIKELLKVELPDDTDLETAERKQQIVRAILQRIIDYKDSGLLFKPEAFHVFMQNIQTDLSEAEVKSLLHEYETVILDHLISNRVHGTTISHESRGMIFSPNDQGDYLRLTVKKTIEYMAGTGEIRPEDLIVKLDVLNGTETSRLAAKAANIYKKYGYEILTVANADVQNAEKTVIIANNGNEKIAKEIGTIIRCRNVQPPKPDTVRKSRADYTIILGNDFDGQYCK